MATPLSGYAGSMITEQMLKGLAMHVGNKAALQTALAELASTLGVTGTELLGSLTTSQTVSGAAGGLARQVAGAVANHGIRAGAVDALVTAAPVALAAPTGVAGWFAGLSVAAQAAVLAAAFAAAALATAGAAQAAGWATADSPAAVATGVQSDARTAEEQASDNSDRAAQAQEEAQTTFEGYAVVQATNHPNRALSVQRLEAINDHTTGRFTIHLCSMLHGGICADNCVTTPNGNVVCGEDVPAQFSVISEHPGTGDAVLTDAWNSLCAQVTDVGPAALAEGFSGSQGGQRVTIDWANTIFVAAPCG